MIKLISPLNKKKLLIFWYFSILFSSPLMAITSNNNSYMSDQNLDKKQEFYSHLCQLQTYIIDPEYKKTIKKKYSHITIFPKEILRKYNSSITSNYEIKDLLNRSSLLSPFHISNSTKKFKKELEKYNIMQLSSYINTFAQFLKQPPQNKTLNSCLTKQYPQLEIKKALNLQDQKISLLKQLQKATFIYQGWIAQNNNQWNKLNQLLTKITLRHSVRIYNNSLKEKFPIVRQKTLKTITTIAQKVHNDTINQPINSILIQLKSKWSIELGHYLYPELTPLGKSLLKDKSFFTKKTYTLLDKKLHSSIAGLQILAKNICQKKITNLHHDIFSVEASILTQISKVHFPDPVIAENLAAYCYLNNTQPKKNIQSTWKSYTGLGVAGVSIIARIFNWIGKKPLFFAGLISTTLFSKDTYDNWKTNFSHKNLYNINKYHSKTNIKILKNIEKDQDLVYLEGGLLLLPALISKLTNFSQSTRIKKISSQFQLNPSKTTTDFININIKNPSKWWPYYNSLVQQLNIKQFKQFFWTTHQPLKTMKMTNAHRIGKKANDFFSKINKNYIAPARYLRNEGFVNTLFSLKRIDKKTLSTDAVKANIEYIEKLITKTHLYKTNVNTVIEQGLEATAQLKRLNITKIKPKSFSSNKKIKISNWPMLKNGKLLNKNTITLHSYNDYKAFLSEIKIKVNYLPSKAIDDLFQTKQLYIEQLKQASHLRKLQIIESKLQLLEKTQKLNSFQLKILSDIKKILKNPDVFPPNRAFKKIFLKELVSEIKYLKQGVSKRKASLLKSYSGLPTEDIEALVKTTSFLTDHIKTILWTGATVSVVGGAATGTQQLGVDYLLAQWQDKMRNISRFFSKTGYTSEEKTCALESENFKKFTICYNQLVKKEIKIDLIKMRNYEFTQNQNSKKDIHEYKVQLYSSVKQKLRDYTYKLLTLRSQFNIQEFLYNLQPQITESLNEQFMYQILQAIKSSLGEKSFQYAKSILTLKISKEESLKKIASLPEDIKTLLKEQSLQTQDAFVLQNILYSIYTNQKNYSIYFKNTGQLPIELKAMIKGKDLIKLQELSDDEEFNINSGGFLEKVDFFPNLVF